MQKFEHNVTDARGNAVVGATISVVTSPGGTPAAIYLDNGSTLISGNSVTSGASGYYSFYAANGRYSRTISGPRLTTTTFSDFEMFDPADNTSTAIVKGTWFGGVVAYLSAMGTSVGASLIGFIQSGVGAVAMSLQALLRERVSITQFGAVIDGTTDNKNAILAAITAIQATGGTVTCPRGICAYSGEIIWPVGVNVVGAGIGATVFKSTAAGARFNFYTAPGDDNRGGGSGGFTLDGNNVGEDLLKLGVAVERGFYDINVIQSNTNGIVLNGAQNCTFRNVHSQHNKAANIVFDYGAGNNRFFGSEVNRGGQWNIKYLQSGASPTGAFPVPSGNKFYGGVIERLGYDGTLGDPDNGTGLIYHGAGRYNSFNGCDIALPGLDSTTKSMIVVRQDNVSDASILLTLNDCTYSGTASRTTVFDVGPSTSIALGGSHLFENHLTVFKVDDAATVTGSFTPTVGGITNYFQNLGAGTQPQQNLIKNTLRGRTEIQSPAGYVAASYRVDGETYARTEIWPGLMRFGVGTAAADRVIQPTSSFGVDGLDFNGTGAPANFVYKFGTTQNLVLPFAPTQAASNGSLCQRTDVGYLYLRENAAWLRVPTINGAALKHARVTTGSIAAGATALVTITWPTAFADANYTPVPTVLDSTTAAASLSVVHLESVTASAVTVRVQNASAGSLTGTVQVIAIHD